MKSVVSGALLALLLPAVMVGCDRGGAAASMPSSSAATAAPASVAPAAASAAGTSASADASAWQAPDKVEKDGPDADLVFQVGDMDNFGFGFPDGFDPFTGASTPSHSFPFHPGEHDADGTDRIMVVGGHRSSSGDGYTGTTSRPDNQPRPLRLAFDLDGVEMKSAALQLFVDDFQSPRWGTHFKATLNGTDVPLLDATLNALDQTGPIGKLITIQLLPEQLPLLREGKLSLLIDDPDHDVADGFAIDFMRLLVNPKPWRHVGTIRGQALDKHSGEPLAGVLVSASNTSETTTDAQGRFVLERVPAGMAVVTGSHTGYQADSKPLDLVAGQTGELQLELEPMANDAAGLGEQLDRQEHVDLYGIYFDTDKASLKPESDATLHQVLALLNARPQLRLRVTGHTDDQGSDAHNLTLSQQRAAAVVAWLVDKGIAADRLQSEGDGETRPVASNATEQGRALNRRVEIGGLK